MEKLFTLVAAHLEYKGYFVELHPTYSGRGMFGKTCFGISTDAKPIVVGAAFGVIMAMNPQLGFNPEDHLPLRQDNLGQDTIYY